MKYLKPVEKLYHALSGLKNLVYEAGLLDSLALQAPVISVGNLSFGGVGKTPCIILLAEELQKTYRLAVVAKSYKTTLDHAAEVDLEMTGAAEYYGDEACLLKLKLPDCAVWSGPVKWKTAKVAAEKADLILIDDGFSHRRLSRNFDLVLVDASCGFDTYLREAKGNLKRADAVLLTKVNLTNPARISTLKNEILQVAPQLKNRIFSAAGVTQLQTPVQQPLFFFCGLGNPQSVLSDLRQQGYQIIEKSFFADHHRYSETDQKNLLQQFLELRKTTPDLKMVTTEKDLIKVFYRPLRDVITVLEHRIEIANDEREDLLAQIRKSL